MATYDWSGVTVSFDQPTGGYPVGATITATVSGTVRKTSDPSQSTETVTATGTIQASDGTTHTVPPQTLNVIHTVPGGVEDLPVTIVSVTGSDRIWTVQPGGLTATTVA